MSVVGSRQKARLFIEGREVPFQQAVVTSKVGAPTTATISLVPIQGIKRIKPRTQVHICLRDTKNFPDNKYYLVFEGEVLGRGYGKKQDSRTMNLVAIDYSSYWDETKSYVMNPNFVLGKVADVIGAQDAPINQTVKALGGQTFQTSATSNTAMISILLSAAITTVKKADGSTEQKLGAPGNKDLAVGVVNVIKKLSGASQFFAAAYERLRISDRINLFSSGNLQTFLKDLQIDEFLADYTGKFGGISDLRTMLYSVMALVFHDFVSVPFPAKIPLKSDKTQNTISQFFFIPDCYSLPAPLCNVVFPNQIVGYDFQDDYRAQPTRYAFRASMPLMTDQGIQYPQYPTQFYPTAFSDYMFGKRTVSDTEKASLLGPSTLLTDPKDPKGRTYASIFYGKDSKTAVGTAFGTVLREADYMSNEESLKGIYLDMDTFMPGYTALAKSASPGSRTNFIQGVGSYLFFKKRFSSRSVTAQILFHPFLVPGFNTIFLDESSAGQSFIAKLQGVTHVLSNDGCATQVDLAYGRDFDEIDDLTGAIGEPPTPPWFDPNIFGEKDTKGLFKKETAYLLKLGAIDDAEKAIRDKVTGPTVFPNLNKFFQSLLGVNSITNYNDQTGLDPKKTPPLPQLVSVRGAVSWLLYQFNSVASDPDARDLKVQGLISRPLVNITDAFKFIYAQPVGYNKSGKFQLPEEFAQFEANPEGTLAGRFDGKTTTGTPASDQEAIKLRRSIINTYVQQLKVQRGFRG